MRKINFPVLIISTVIFVILYVLFIYPIAAKNLEGDLTLPDTLKLDSKNVIKSDTYDFQLMEDNNMMVVNYYMSEHIQFEYKINTNHKRIHGKIINLTQESDGNKIATVTIYGDNKAIVYKNEWDLSKSDKIEIDEPLDKIRTLKFVISYYSHNEVSFGLVDFFVTSDGDV